MTLPFTLTLTVLLQRNTPFSLYLFPLLLLSYLALNAAKFSIPFGRVKRQPQARWSSKVKEVKSKRCKAFASAHRNDKDRQAYITASRYASSVIAKVKAEAWQATC